MSNQAEEQPVHPNLASLLSLDYRPVLQEFLNVLPFADALGLRVLDKRTKSAIDRLLEQGDVVALKRYHNKLTLTPNDLVFNGNTQKYDLITEPITYWMNLHLTFLALHDQRFVHFLPWLRMHGPQVYTLLSRCCMKYDNGNPVSILKNLRSVLICTEKVQMIGLAICCNYPEPEIEQRWANQVTNFLEKYPFPPLRKLYHVSFYLYPDLFPLPTCAFNIFQHFFHAYEAQLRSMEFKVQTLDQLEVLQHSNAPLEHLDITIHPNSTITPTQVLRALQTFQSTLQELVWKQECNFADIHRPLGKWSQVKCLQLIVDSFAIEYTDDSWLWLGSFPGLRHLRMGDENERYWHFMGQTMYDSNIWTRLPNLQTLQIYESMLTRSIYEEQCANNQ